PLELGAVGLGAGVGLAADLVMGDGILHHHGLAAVRTVVPELDHQLVAAALDLGEDPAAADLVVRRNDGGAALGLFHAFAGEAGDELGIDGAAVLDGLDLLA